MTLPISRVAFYSGLLLLAVFAVFAVAAVFAHSSGCDECCSTGTCGDCGNCHCASTCFVLPTYVSSEMYVEVSGPNSSVSHELPDPDWCSDLFRPPRLICI